MTRAGFGEERVALVGAFEGGFPLAVAHDSVGGDGGGGDASRVMARVFEVS